MMHLILRVFVIFFIADQAFSSSPPSRLPSTNYDNKYASINKATIDDDNGDNKILRQSSSAITFLYELYEHEIYNPSTDSWTSRRFTQSPVTGGGGRDSTSRKLLLLRLTCQMI